VVVLRLVKQIDEQREKELGEYKMSCMKDPLASVLAFESI
jgi:hypothetical protein